MSSGHWIQYGPLVASSEAARRVVAASPFGRRQFDPLAAVANVMEAVIFGTGSWCVAWLMAFAYLITTARWPWALACLCVCFACAEIWGRLTRRGAMPLGDEVMTWALTLNLCLDSEPSAEAAAQDATQTSEQDQP